MTNPPTDERRAEFEKWAISEGFTVEAFDKEREKCFWPQTQLAWRAWQAALSHQGEVVKVSDLRDLEQRIEWHPGETEWIILRDDLDALISKAEKAS